MLFKNAFPLVFSRKFFQFRQSDLVLLVIAYHNGSRVLKRWAVESQQILLWENGQTSDAEFVAVLQYRVQAGILVVSEIETVASAAGAGQDTKS